MVNLKPFWSLSRLMKIKIRSTFVYNASNQKIENLNNYKGQNYEQQQCAKISTRVILDYSLIIIMNTGQSDAKNIKIILDGTPINDYPGIIDKNMRNTIAPKRSIAIQACVGAEIFPSDSIEITWTDEEGEGKVYRNYLCV